VGLLDDGSWGPLRPHRPYLRRSHWTSVATGAYPRRHRGKSRWAWRLPWLGTEPVRLLPWLPGEMRWLLPWGAARREHPPSSTVPPLWQRLDLTGGSNVVLGWPGFWDPGTLAAVAGPVPADTEDPLPAAARVSLDAALEPFPQRRATLLNAIRTDLARFSAARRAVASGSGSVWLHLLSLAAVRRHLEPVRALDTREREVLGLVLDLVDERLGALLAVAKEDTLLVVLSPTGFDPPDGWERILRLLGLGGRWRATAKTCPDGALLIVGDGVVVSHRFSAAHLPDVAPTLCYLLGLPVAQYMEGRVILDVIEPDYLASNPLIVVD
jgi:hypothetical protein